MQARRLGLDRRRGALCSSRLGRRRRSRLGLFLEERGVTDAQAVEPVEADDAERGQAVAQAALEVDAAGFGEIPNGYRYVAEPEAEPHGLDEELRVENEVVRVALEGHALKDLPPEDAEAAVEVAQVLAQGDVFARGQESVADVL